MTALFANSHSMQLSAALGNIGELKNSVADMMQHRLNFTDVVHTQGEVAGIGLACASPSYIFTSRIERSGRSRWRRGTLRMVLGQH